VSEGLGCNIAVQKLLAFNDEHRDSFCASFCAHGSTSNLVKTTKLGGNITFMRIELSTKIEMHVFCPSC
jgi:hypothetical protein